jgi:hypothetical protein
MNSSNTERGDVIKAKPRAHKGRCGRAASGARGGVDVEYGDDGVDDMVLSHRVSEQGGG